MHKTSISFLFMLVLGLFLLTAGCTQEQPIIATPPQENTDTLPQDTYTSNETLIAFVDSAAAYAKTNGKEKALAEFNNPNGSFIDGELYIYAYTFNGTTLAHPVSPEKVGLYRLDEGDTGIFLRGYIESVKNGSGFYQLNYVNPTHDKTLESKLVYGVKIDDDWWLGSGIYTGPAYPSPEQ
ncbi:cache domain-containing protein [Methanogenium marinum]|uniref:Cache domain-containing protein n=1 Tax=Methanogenium marinum TaxID=348610 RepID=A0A9Q4PUY3_9EURY|nr:cache domain-containing protein [Methanogenium marinum]MDE4907405.1 cache domain-containing protein [Methanogenium marinum]